MKLVKNLLLGSVAGIAAITGAQAADLPLAEPVEYVRICDTWGNGFFYIPGTQTCLQVSGLVRFDLRYDEPFDRSNDALTFRGRAQLNFDARTQTEMGTLRSYLRLRGNYTNDGGNDYFVHQAFVQFAGITAGRTQSFFDNVYDGTFTGAYNSEVTSTALLGYTATFGSGFSASLSIEDRSSRERGGSVGSGGLAGAGIVYAGTTVPDVVANLRVAQGWGSFQLSGAIHQNRSYNDDPTQAGFQFNGSDDELGFAVQAAGAVNLPFGGKGTRLWASAAYADGALSYLGQVAVPWVGTGAGGIAFNDSYSVADGAGGFDLESTSGWALTGGGTWYFNPALRSNVTLGYADVDSDVSTATGLGLADFSQFIAVANVVYSPVQNLDLGLEVFYRNITDDSFATPVITNDDSFGALARVERKF
jgi:hypothetical protein